MYAQNCGSQVILSMSIAEAKTLAAMMGAFSMLEAIVPEKRAQARELSAAVTVALEPPNPYGPHFGGIKPLASM